MLIAIRSGTDPITRFPSRAVGGTAEVKASHSGQIAVVGGGGSLILGGAALEADRAASEVMSAAVGDGAVPIPRADVGAGGETEGRRTNNSSAAVASAAEIGPRLSTSVTRIPSLKVEMVARPAIPIPRPTHPVFFFFFPLCVKLK